MNSNINLYIYIYVFTKSIYVYLKFIIAFNWITVFKIFMANKLFITLVVIFLYNIFPMLHRNINSLKVQHSLMR